MSGLPGRALRVRGQVFPELGARVGGRLTGESVQMETGALVSLDIPEPVIGPPGSCVSSRSVGVS